MDSVMLGNMPSWDPVSSSYSEMPFPHTQIVPTYFTAGNNPHRMLYEVEVYRGMGGDKVDDAGSGATTVLSVGGRSYPLYHRRKAGEEGSLGGIDKLWLYLPMYV